MLINFFGKRGSGKTTAIEGQLPNCRGPVCVLDLLGNFNSDEYIQLNKTDEMILLIQDYVKDPTDKQKIFVLKTGDPDLAVDYISAALWEAAGGTLVLDECDGFNISNAPCFDQLIRYGRNRNIDLITGVRRPAEISRNITAGANKIFCFKTQEPRDVDYFKTTLLGEKAERLITLEDYHGLYIDYDTNESGEFRTDENGSLYILTNEKL